VAKLDVMAFDVSEADFQARVVDRSRELPVVVDFWAEWCGPCRVLGPALEAAVAKRAGEVELAKLDTDRNPNLAMSFGIRGIPAVKAFRDGEVVAEFTGAIPPPRIEEFLDRLVPSEADRLAAAGDEESLRKALELDPRNAVAARQLGRLLLERGDAAGALEALDGLHGDFEAEGLAARARLALELGDRTDGDGTIVRSFEAWDAGELEVALEALQEAVTEADDPERRDLLRQIMVAIFTELGADHPLAREHRRRLAAALS
jgi:putative thioredoxin